jgi:hypothetical protein
MKYKVIDEDGLAIRLFATKAEAVAFLQLGWSISRMPIKDGLQEITHNGCITVH